MARILATYVTPACAEASERMPVYGVTFELGVEVEVSERVAAKLRCLPYFTVRDGDEFIASETTVAVAEPLRSFPESQPEHRAPRRAIAVDVKALPRRLGRGKV